MRPIRLLSSLLRYIILSIRLLIRVDVQYLIGKNKSISTCALVYTYIYIYISDCTYTGKCLWHDPIRLGDNQAWRACNTSVASPRATSKAHKALELSIAMYYNDW